MKTTRIRYIVLAALISSSFTCIAADHALSHTEEEGQLSKMLKEDLTVENTASQNSEKNTGEEEALPAPSVDQHFSLDGDAHFGRTFHSTLTGTVKYHFRYGHNAWRNGFRRHYATSIRPVLFDANALGTKHIETPNQAKEKGQHITEIIDESGVLDKYEEKDVIPYIGGAEYTFFNGREDEKGRYKASAEYPITEEAYNIAIDAIVEWAKTKKKTSIINTGGSAIIIQDGERLIGANRATIIITGDKGGVITYDKRKKAAQDNWASNISVQGGEGQANISLKDLLRLKAEKLGSEPYITFLTCLDLVEFASSIKMAEHAPIAILINGAGTPDPNANKLRGDIIFVNFNIYSDFEKNADKNPDDELEHQGDGYTHQGSGVYIYQDIERSVLKRTIIEAIRQFEIGSKFLNYFDPTLLVEKKFVRTRHVAETVLKNEGRCYIWEPITLPERVSEFTVKATEKVLQDGKESASNYEYFYSEDKERYDPQHDSDKGDGRHGGTTEGREGRPSKEPSSEEHHNHPGGRKGGK